LRCPNYRVFVAVILFCFFLSFTGLAQHKKVEKAVSDHNSNQTNYSNSDDNYYRDIFSDTWVATDPPGRDMPACKTTAVQLAATA
jgi:hypothetical protein